MVQGISVIGVSSLKETMEYIQGIKEYENTNVEQPAVDTSEYLYDIDFSDVVGQESIKRGMEIAAAGFHNVLLTGAAGAGKSMLAKRLPTIVGADGVETDIPIKLSGEEALKLKESADALKEILASLEL